MCIFENDAIAEGSRKESECFQKYRNVGRWAEGGRKETSEGVDVVCVGRAAIFARFCSEFSCRFLCVMSLLHCIVDLHESGGLSRLKKSRYKAISNFVCSSCEKIGRCGQHFDDCKCRKESRKDVGRND